MPMVMFMLIEHSVARQDISPERGEQREEKSATAVLQNFLTSSRLLLDSHGDKESAGLEVTCKC